MPSLRQLNDPAWIARHDPKGVRHSIERLGEQWEAAWNGIMQIPNSQFPIPNSESLHHIVIAGMGGSALGAHIAGALYAASQQLPLPRGRGPRVRDASRRESASVLRKSALARPSFTIVNDYALPPWVGPNTLVVLSSYSGDTEETLACARMALARKAKMVGITTGGKLASWLRLHKIPALIFTPTANPAGAPRLAVGYAAGAMVGLLARLKILDFTPHQNKFGAGQGFKISDFDPSFLKTRAKKLALALKDRALIIVGGGHLAGSAHVLQNQLHETAKTFTTHFPLPELNHHLMEGLKFPKSNPKTLAVLMLDGGPLYSRPLQRRLALTEIVVRKQKIPAHRVTLHDGTPVGQAYEMLVFGSHLAYYLALLHGINPVTNEWVDYFKKKLGS